MEAQHKKVLKAVSLELRHLLEGSYDAAGQWHPGDLEQRLAAIGVRRDRESVKADELPHLSLADQKARQVVDAYLQLRAEAGVAREEAVAEFVRETAYTWANRLLALRCMEARELIDEVVLQKPAYGGRSLEHHRLAQRHPELCADEDDGLLAVLDKVFAEQARHMPMLFDHEAPGVTLKPSAAAIKRCMALLSDSQKVGDQDVATSDVFKAHDAFGWAYQYWNTEEKDRVFTKVRTQKGAKIEGADIISATQLYTEPYMVKFLVQNSLGATWMGMHPDSKLCESWEYYVRDADRSPVEKKSVAEITFLDPACGSGHFLLEAFDLLYDMYQEEGELTKPEEICEAILTQNLFGIDIDPRAVQIAEVALWMKAAERAFDYRGVATNLVAATGSHLKGEAWEQFLAGFEREPSVARVLRKFAQSMEHIDEIGSLARPVEDLREIIRQEHVTWERQVRERKEANYLFPEIRAAALSGQLPFHEIDDEEFGDRLFYRVRAGIDGFTERARAAGEFEDQMLGSETRAGFRLVDLLSRHYDVVGANPPYMGSRNQGDSLRGHLETHFQAGKGDIYAAFIMRCDELVHPSGRIAIVAQQSWMFVGAFSKLRCGTVSTDGIVQSRTLETLTHLGRYAFSEIGNAAVAPLMFVMNRHSPQASHRLWACRLTTPRPSDEQDRLLRQSVKGDSSQMVYRPFQRRFVGIPSKPVCYWLSDRLLDLFDSGKPLGMEADCIVACKTSKNARFVRCWWETPNLGSRWKMYEKDAVGFRFGCCPLFAIDWSPGARRFYREHYSAQLPNEDYLFRQCVVTSKISGPQSTARILCGTALADMAVNQVFLKHPGSKLHSLCALLNSTLAVFYLRLLNPTLNSQPFDLARLPLAHLLDDEHVESELASLCETGERAVEEMLAGSPNRLVFTETLTQGTISSVASGFVCATKRAVAEILTLRQRVDELVEHALRLTDEDVALIHREITVTDETDDEQQSDESAAEVDEPLLSIDTAVAEIAESRVLQLLGHRWPKQMKAGEPVPDWADRDGIIPLTPLANESTLFDRVQQRLRANEVDASDFAEVIGKSLDAWLATEFFKHHTKQFKKRPIAWQLQSGKFTARTSPAFACLVYYHKLDADTLPKLRSQYVGPLRQRLETELRGIESTAVAARSDRQEKRRAELEDQIEELRQFDGALANVITEGFASKQLTEIAKNEPLDRWCSFDGQRESPDRHAIFLQQESAYFPDINDGVRVNIAPLQKAGLLAADVIAKKDLDKAIADRAEWRADERRWCREGKLPQPGWWPEEQRS